MNKNVFNDAVFHDPPRFYRPLQIIHGMDRMTDLEEERPDVGEDISTDRQFPPESIDFKMLDEYLQKLVDLGTGGIVTNVGFANYLTDPKQWDILRYGVKKADELGLKIWLYDEKGYPSGTAGGYVNRAYPEYVSLSLACYTIDVNPGEEAIFPLPVSCKRFVWAGATRTLDFATHEDFIDLCEFIDDWQVLRWTAPEESWKVIYLAERHTYEGTHASRNVSDFKQYINLLNEAAVKAFIRVTHEAYLRELGPNLWGKIDAVFTDEPSFVTQYLPELPDRYVGKIPVVDAPIFIDRPPALPWLNDLPERFKQLKGYDLIPHLYALFFSETEEAMQVRMDYYQLITDIYAESFFKQIQDWCHFHGIDSSGHVLLEESIIDHPVYEGSVMRMLETMDLPGIDMLNADPQAMLHEESYMGASFMAIKQASSAAHLAGRERIHSESSDWVQRNTGAHAPLEQRIGQANLQYALGINVITSYYSWKEIGEAGWRNYNDTVGRLGLLLTGGTHRCDVAVLYPIRTAWAHFLPPLEPMESWDKRPMRTEWLRRLQKEYTDTVRVLLTNQIDCDIVDEESINRARISDGKIEISGESYRVLILPSIDTLSLSFTKVVKKFVESGGILLTTGDIPRLAESKEYTSQLIKIFTGLFSRYGNEITTSLDYVVEAIRQRLGADLILSTPNPNIVYTHRELGGRNLYFVANCAPETTHLNINLRIPGPYNLYWPKSGMIERNITEVVRQLDGYDSVFIISRNH